MSQELIERLERVKAGPMYPVTLGGHGHSYTPLPFSTGGTAMVGPTEFERVVIDTLIELLKAKEPSAPPQRVHVQTVGPCEWCEQHQCYMPTDGRHTSLFSTGN